MAEPLQSWTPEQWDEWANLLPDGQVKNDYISAKEKGELFEYFDMMGTIATRDFSEGIAEVTIPPPETPKAFEREIDFEIEPEEVAEAGVGGPPEGIEVKGEIAEEVVSKNKDVAKIKHISYNEFNSIGENELLPILRKTYPNIDFSDNVSIFDEIEATNLLGETRTFILNPANDPTLHHLDIEPGEAYGKKIYNEFKSWAEESERNVSDIVKEIRRKTINANGTSNDIFIPIKNKETGELEYPFKVMNPDGEERLATPEQALELINNFNNSLEDVYLNNIHNIFTELAPHEAAVKDVYTAEEEEAVANYLWNKLKDPYNTSITGDINRETFDALFAEAKGKAHGKAWEKGKDRYLAVAARASLKKYDRDWYSGWRQKGARQVDVLNPKFKKIYDQGRYNALDKFKKERRNLNIKLSKIGDEIKKAQERLNLGFLSSNARAETEKQLKEKIERLKGVKRELNDLHERNKASNSFDILSEIDLHIPKDTWAIGSGYENLGASSYVYDEYGNIREDMLPDELKKKPEQIEFLKKYNVKKLFGLIEEEEIKKSQYYYLDLLANQNPKISKLNDKEYLEDLLDDSMLKLQQITALGDVTTVDWHDNALDVSGIFDEPTTFSFMKLREEGLGSEDFKGWWDSMTSNLSKEDLHRYQIWEENMNRISKDTKALWNLYNLNIDTGETVKAGGVYRTGEVALETVGSDWFGVEDFEKEEVFGKTIRDGINDFKIAIDNYNTQKEVVEGIQPKMQLTEKQSASIAKELWSESVAEGVGGFVPMLIEFAIVSYATGGVMALPRIAAAFRTMPSITRHFILGSVEEIKMQHIFDFAPSAGADFYVAGAATQNMFNHIPLLNRFKWLKPMFDKVVKTGPTAALASETASISEAAYDDLFNNKNFSHEFNELFGDVDEVTKRIIVNSLVFGITGVTHVKKTDFMSTNKKLKALQHIGKEINAITQGTNLEGKPRTRNFNELSLKEQTKLQDLENAYSTMLQQWQVENRATQLDPKSPNFEKNFNNINMKPYNEIGRLLNPEHKDVKAKFGKGKGWREANGFKEGETAVWDPKTNIIAVDLNTYTPGKPVHELVHAAMNIHFQNNPRAKVAFTERMSEIFKDFDFGGMSGTILGDKITAAYGSWKQYNKEGKPTGKKIIGYGAGIKKLKGDPKSGEWKWEPPTKELEAKEYLAFMAEFLSDPAVYRNNPKLAGKFLNEVKLEIKDMWWEFAGRLGVQMPVPKTAQQVVELFYSFGRSTQMGTRLKAKAAAIASLDKVNILGIKVEQQLKEGIEAAQKEKTKEVVEASRDLSDIIVENVDIRAEMLELKEGETVEDALKKPGKPILPNQQQVVRIVDNNLGMAMDMLNKYEIKYDFKLDPEVKDEAFFDLRLRLIEYASRYDARKNDVGAYLNMGYVNQTVNALRNVGAFEKKVDVGDFETFAKSYLQETTGDFETTRLKEEQDRLAKIDPLEIIEDKGVQKEITEEVNVRLEEIDLAELTYKTVPDLSEISLEFGVKESKVNNPDGTFKQKGSTRLSQKEVTSVQNFIDQPGVAKMIWDVHFPKAYTGRGAAEGIRGYSTGVQTALLKLYEAGTKAQATGPGLVGKEKPRFNEKVFKELFGINADGTRTILKEGTKQVDSKIDSAIKALIHQVGKAITNKTIRDAKDKFGLTANVIENIASGKADLMASRELTEGIGTENKKMFLEEFKATDFKREVVNLIVKGAEKISEYKNLIGKNIQEADLKWYEDLTDYKKRINKAANEYWDIQKKWSNVDLYRDKKRQIEKGEIELDKFIGDLIKERVNYEDFPDLITSELFKDFEISGRMTDHAKDPLKIEFFRVNEFTRVNEKLDSPVEVVDKKGNITERLKTKAEKIDALVDVLKLGTNHFTAGGVPGKRKQMFEAKKDYAETIIKEVGEKHGIDIEVIWHESGKQYGDFKDIKIDGETISKERFKMKPQASQKFIYDIANFKDLSTERQTEIKNEIEERRTEVNEIRKDLVEQYKWHADRLLSEGSYDPIDFMLFHQSMNSNMKTLGRAAAKLKYVALPLEGESFKEREGVFGKLNEWEHTIPARDVLNELAWRAIYKPGTEMEAFKGYDIAQIPDFMNTLITDAGFGQIRGRIEGRLPRYYATETLGSPDIRRVLDIDKFLETGSIEKSTIGDAHAIQAELARKLPKEVLTDNRELLREGDMMASKDLSNTDIINELGSRDEAMRRANLHDKPVKKIRVFDFDDTLARTKSNVLYTMPDGKKGKLTAEEFAKRSVELESKGAKFDFSEFSKVMEGKKGPLFKVAEMIADKRGTKDIFVLTARPPDAAPAIKEFLKSLGLDIPLENITGLADGNPKAKANWITEKAAEGYNDFYFADDHTGNVKAVKEALSIIDVKSKVQQAMASKDLDQNFNKILEQTSGIEWYKEFSPAKARIAGAKKGKFKFFLPPSAEDFLGLIYPTLAKGKIGEQQMEWYKDNLLKPYARAIENLSTDRLNLMQDFRKLKKELDVPKDLKKPAKPGFNNEQAIRVYLWDKAGERPPGLSLKDSRELTAIVENNPKLKAFADQLLTITKGDGYGKAGEHWLVGNITTDLIDLLGTTKRQKYLQDWQRNADIIFSDKNLNKLEALYGRKHREALENMLARMKSGKNRTGGGNKLSNQVLDYINSSTGAIMFFNTRSAVLQTISAANFINWSFNNPLRAGKAFANQPQYWKDFVDLINSDYLVDRRNGLKLNINENEIAEAAKTSKNKAKAALNYILEKGYIPTKYADSFAIATGGATFYRNRIKDLIKRGVDETNAKAIALREFREISEISQQSSRPDKISMQQASDLGRITLQFVNTPMQYARMQKRAVQDLAAGRGSAKSHVSRIIYYGVIQNLMFNALQQSLFALGFGDEPEEKDEERLFRTANGMADSILRGIGLAGVTVQVLKNLGIDIYKRSKKSRPDYKDAWIKLLEFSPAIKYKLSKLSSAGWPFDTKKRRQEVFDKGWSLDNPAFQSMAKVISAVTNVPLERLYTKYENIKEAVADDTELWQSIAMVLGWPAWDIKSESGTYNKDRELSEIKSYTKQEQISILKQHGYSQDEIDKLKKEDDRANAILKSQIKAKKTYKPDESEVSAINEKRERKKELYNLSKNEQTKILRKLGISTEEINELRIEGNRVNKIISMRAKNAKKVDKAIGEQKEYKPTKAEKRAMELYDLNKDDQINILKNYLSDKEIRALKYEQDRVDKIIELQEDN